MATRSRNFPGSFNSARGTKPTALDVLAKKKFDHGIREIKMSNNAGSRNNTRTYSTQASHNKDMALRNAALNGHANSQVSLGHAATAGEAPAARAYGSRKGLVNSPPKRMAGFGSIPRSADSSPSKMSNKDRHRENFTKSRVFTGETLQPARSGKKVRTVA